MFTSYILVLHFLCHFLQHLDERVYCLIDLGNIVDLSQFGHVRTLKAVLDIKVKTLGMTSFRFYIYQRISILPELIGKRTRELHANSVKARFVRSKDNLSLEINLKSQVYSVLGIQLHKACSQGRDDVNLCVLSIRSAKYTLPARHHHRNRVCKGINHNCGI